MKNDFEDVMGEPIKVFVSSDMGELKPERKVAKNTISDLCLEPVWFEGIPASSRSPRYEFTHKVRGCHIFTLILWRSFTKSVCAEYNEAVDCAKPVLIFLKKLKGKEKREPELDALHETLIGEAESNQGMQTVYHRFGTLRELSLSLKQALMNELSKNYEPPRLSQSRQELYEMGKDIIKNAQKRLYIVQRTPSLFLGSRPYGYEQDFLKQLENWIEAAEKNAKRELLYMFSPTLTRKDIESLKQRGPAFGAKVAGRIAKYKRIEDKSLGRLRFLPITAQFSGPMIVGDNRFAIWILDTDRAVALSQENDALAAQLVHLLATSVKSHVPAAKVLEELGLLGGA